VRRSTVRPDALVEPGTECSGRHAVAITVRDGDYELRAQSDGARTANVAPGMQLMRAAAAVKSGADELDRRIFARLGRRRRGSESQQTR
jgi:hypothetical protein